MVVSNSKHKPKSGLNENANLYVSKNSIYLYVEAANNSQID